MFIPSSPALSSSPQIDILTGGIRSALFAVARL